MKYFVLCHFSEMNIRRQEFLIFINTQ